MCLCAIYWAPARLHLHGEHPRGRGRHRFDDAFFQEEMEKAIDQRSTPPCGCWGTSDRGLPRVLRQFEVT